MTALDLARELHDLLRRAADDAAQVATPLRELDAPRLLGWAEQRQAVRDHAAAHEKRLVAALGDGPRSEPIAAELAAIRREAARLQRIDEDNAALASRTLRVVRGFTSVLAPQPEAYDRRGLARLPARAGTF